MPAHAAHGFGGGHTVQGHGHRLDHAEIHDVSRLQLGKQVIAGVGDHIEVVNAAQWSHQADAAVLAGHLHDTCRARCQGNAGSFGEWAHGGGHDDVFAVEAQLLVLAALDVDHKAIEDGDIDTIPRFQIEGCHVKTDGDDLLVPLGIDHLDHFLIRQNNIHDAAKMRDFKARKLFRTETGSHLRLHCQRGTHRESP